MQYELSNQAIRLLESLEYDLDRHFWYKLELWDEYEATALFLDKNPQAVNRNYITNIYPKINIDFAIKAEKILTILNTHIEHERMKNRFFASDCRISSIYWIKLAKKKNVSMPEDMYELVCSYNQEDTTDWKAKYNNLQKENEVLIRGKEGYNKKIQHGKESSLKHMIAMFAVAYYESKYSSDINILKIGELLNANNLYKNDFSSINFDKYNFKPPSQETFTEHFKDVREKLGFSPTAAIHKNNR